MSGFRYDKANMIDMMLIHDFLLPNLLMPLWLSHINDTLNECSPVFDNMVGVALPILQLTALFVCFYLLIILLCWMFGFVYKGVIILPFDNSTRDDKYDGKGISDLLLAELRRIHELHSEKSDLRIKQESSIPKSVKYGRSQFPPGKSSDSPRLITESLSNC